MLIRHKIFLLIIWEQWGTYYFLNKYDPEQFEIIKFRKGDDNKDLRVNGKAPYFRILIKRKKHKNISLKFVNLVYIYNLKIDYLILV